MNDSAHWMERLETEIARELGQTVAIAAGGTPPEPDRSYVDVLKIPGGRLFLAADSSEAEDFFAEARLLEAGRAGPAEVQELWTGVLASVSARMGGQRESPGAGEAFPAEPFTLRLGRTSLRIALRVEAVTADGKSDPVEEMQRGMPANGNLDLLLEVELDASVRFGSREMELRELFELGPGDVVELDRHLSDPVDLIVGDKIVARGEVVLVNGNFGLRVTEVAEPMRRLESIRWLS